MTVHDWRDAAPSLLRACYAREQRAWLQRLGWDTAWTWAQVELARVRGGLDGLLAVDSHGTVQGWTFGMLEHGRFHIGGLVASSPEVTAVLLDAVVDSHASDTEIACFIHDRAPGLVDALSARGFEVEPFPYLCRPLTALDARQASTLVEGASTWDDTDFAAAAALLEASYRPDAARHFAPGGAFAAWVRYLSGVVHQAGCGRFDRVATGVSRDVDGLQGLSLVTAISARTAHLAQLAVHPQARGHRVATRLLRHALSHAAREGRAAMTLLVGEHNQPARRLYESLGFDERATFVAASRRGAFVNALPAPAHGRELLAPHVG